MSLHAVQAWRDRLRSEDPGQAAPHLSPEGARLALDAALDALHDDALRSAAEMAGAPFGTASVVCARTVFTAPLEWCAVLLARGTQVVCKLPAGVPGLGAAMATHADDLGLPLTVTDDRAQVHEAALVVAMGSDRTVREIGARVGAGSRYLGFGNRYSVAWIREASSLEALAMDAVLHDGAGCMSPAAVLTDLPESTVFETFGAALERAHTRWPRGALAPADGAAIRTRSALARVLGAVAEGPGWSLHALPPNRFHPASLPRSLAVHRTARSELGTLLTGPLSTIGTDDPATIEALGLDGTRICAPGEMQRPPLHRHHDGVDWLAATLRD